MEYADDGDLYQKICQYKKMNLLMEESDIWRVFIQMVKGLKILHDLKILHRDLKSANILLFNDGTAKIGDCNVSKIFYGEKGLGYTQTGTPYYASPEVWSEAPYDQKSDIWSLGVITYEMLTLHPPFKAGTMEALYKKIIKGQYNKINRELFRDLSCFTCVLGGPEDFFSVVFSSLCLHKDELVENNSSWDWQGLCSP